MTTTPPTGWTAGQKVFLPAYRSYWGGNPGQAKTIDRVTPSGRAVIGATQYAPDGRPVGDRRGERIEPFTEAHAAAILLWDRQILAERLADKIKWRTLDAAQLDIALPALQALIETLEGTAQ